MRAGLDFTHLVTFDDGAPDGEILWALRSLGGTEIAAGTVTPPTGAVSVLLSVAGSHNQLAPGVLRGFREFVWSYAVGGVARTGVIEYTIEGRVPFPVSVRGVREKLGVNAQDLPDEEIDLIGAYWKLPTAAAAYENMETAPAYVLANGIEALAALDVLDSLQIRVAKMESSGTNTYQRATIDWEKLRAKLQSDVAAATDLLGPAQAGGDTLFMLATITDDFGG